MYEKTRASLARLAAGLGIATAVSLSVGLLIGMFPYARAMVSQLVSMGGFPQLLLPPVNV